jgi:16S rRNA (cytosine1402-N4)-methyltransferase
MNAERAEPSPTIHIPVLLDEVLEGLQVKPGSVVVDGTLGGGGHLRRLAEAADPGRVVAMDRDAVAVARVRARWDGPAVKMCQANFTEIPEVLRQLEWPAADAIILDLGLSSDQLQDRERGFSFDADGPLDLRFDRSEGQPAWELLQHLGEKRLADTIYQYGEERLSRRIARKIVETRKSSPIQTARELADIVRRCVPKSGKIDSATRTFQALRIAVNEELRSLELALQRIPSVLAPNGRLAVISFHSLEDRQVKQAFRDDERYNVLTKKPIRPNQAELIRNPRSRSAKLRVAERRDMA